jgi:hypothetical protein
MIGLLMVLAVVAIAAAGIPLLTRATGGKSTYSQLTVPAIGRTVSGNTSAAGSDVAAAEAVACRTSYAAAQAAVSSYEAETGSRPTSISQVERLVRDPLSTPFFAIGIDPRKPGQLQVATHGHPGVDGNANCAAAGI